MNCKTRKKKLKYYKSDENSTTARAAERATFTKTSAEASYRTERAGAGTLIKQALWPYKTRVPDEAQVNEAEGQRKLADNLLKKEPQLDKQ